MRNKIQKTKSIRMIIEEIFFNILMIISSVIIGSSLLLILGTIIIKGIPILSWDMISKPPSGGFYLGGDGGILNAIIGSLLLALGAVLISFAISLPIILYLNLYRKQNSHFVNFTRLCFDVLWGIPSIIYGAFGFMLMISFGMKASLFAGILTVALLILPILSRSIDEVISKIPKELKFASYALGSTRLETGFKVILKQSIPGILTAIIIAFGRAIGDAAAVIFTAGFSDNIPNSLLKPVATLPLTIFFQLGSPFEVVQNRAYASALILTIIILVINIIVRLLNRMFSKNIIK